MHFSSYCWLWLTYHIYTLGGQVPKLIIFYFPLSKQPLSSKLPVIIVIQLAVMVRTQHESNNNPGDHPENEPVGLYLNH